MKFSHGSYGPCVRVRTTFGPPPSTDVLVEVKDIKSPKGWREVARFNTNDSGDPFIKADVAARAARRSIIEGETP